MKSILLTTLSVILGYKSPIIYGLIILSAVLIMTSYSFFALVSLALIALLTFLKEKYTH